MEMEPTKKTKSATAAKSSKALSPSKANTRCRVIAYLQAVGQARAEAIAIDLNIPAMSVFRVLAERGPKTATLGFECTLHNGLAYWRFATTTPNDAAAIDAARKAFAKKPWPPNSEAGEEKDDGDDDEDDSGNEDENSSDSDSGSDSDSDRSVGDNRRKPPCQPRRLRRRHSAAVPPHPERDPSPAEINERAKEVRDGKGFTQEGLEIPAWNEKTCRERAAAFGGGGCVRAGKRSKKETETSEDRRANIPVIAESELNAAARDVCGGGVAGES